MSLFLRASSWFALASLAGCSLIFDFPEEGVLGGQGGEPHGANDPSGPGGSGGAGAGEIGGGGGNGGNGGSGGGPACVFEPTFDWSFTLGTVGVDLSRKLAEGIDPDGDLWIAGQLLSGQLLIAGNPAPNSGDGAADIYLIELDPIGDLKRGFVFGGTGWAFVRDLAIADDGKLALIGAFAGDMTFGVGGPVVTAAPQVDPLNAPGFEECDAWVAIFDPDTETFPYAKGYGAGDGEYQEGTSVVFTSTGDLLVAAAVDDSALDWGGGAPVIDGIALAKLDSTLTEIWSRPLNTGIDLPGHLALMPDDSFVIAGTTYASNVFGQTQQGEVSYGGPDAFVAHYTTDGDWMWHRIFGDENQQTSTNVAIGPSGDVYVAGTFKQGLKEKGVTVLFEGAETDYYTEDIFFARLDADRDGSTQWVDRIFGLGYQEAQDLVIGCGERVFVVGDISDFGHPGVDFGDGVAVPTEGTDDYEDLFYATYAGEDGGLLSSRRVGDDYIEFARGLVLDMFGGFILVGSFYDTVTFDNSPGGQLQSLGQSDIFAVRFGSAQ